MKTSGALSFLDLRRYRWLPHLLIVMTIFAVLAGIVLIRFVEHRFVEVTGKQLTLGAAEVAEKLDRMLFERRGDVLMMARTFSLRMSDPSYLSEYLKWMQKEYSPAYLSLAVLDVQGTVVAATEPLLVGRNYNRAESFTVARTTRGLHVTDVSVQETGESGVDAIAFTAPILDSRGAFQGVVALQVGIPFLEEVTTRTIQTLETQQSMGGQVEYQMVTRHGRVFVDSELPHKGAINLKELKLPSVLLSESGVPGFIEEEHLQRHVQMVTGYAQTKGFGEFDGLGWSVLIRMERQDILAPLHAILWKVGIVGGVIWIPMLGLLFWATARLRAEHRQAQQESAWAKAAEAALLQSQARNRAIVDTALDAVITIDSSGIVTDWNAQATAIFGWTREEVLGTALSETIIPERDRQAHAHGLREFLRTGTGAILGRRIEIVAQHKDGREFPVELAVSPAKIGEAYIFSAFIRDITERRRAERRLVSQYAVTRVLSEATTMEEAVLKIVQAIGENMEWDLGVFWRVDKATGVLRCFDQWKAPSVQADQFIQETWQRVFASGEGLPGGIWASGKSAWLPDVTLDDKFLRGTQARQAGLQGAFGFPIRVGTEIEGVIEFFSRHPRPPDDDLLRMVEDIGLKINQFGERARTEGVLRETEAQLRQAQKMEAVGRLAGGMAHDFNNLLTVIRGYSELLLGRLGPADPTRKDIEEVKKAADRASGLTRQLLAFSRRQFVSAKVLDLNALIANMDGMLRRLIGEDIVELSADLDVSTGCIKADPGQVEQVIMNLVVNAKDAMPKGGRLTIETRNVTIGEEVRLEAVGVTPGSYVLLAVRDNGHGMDAETRSHLFEPFFTTKEKGKGTGLGLSTVYGIVKQSGGYITVESAPGVGTAFRIYFPRVELERSALTEGAEAIDPARGRETILLVEDEPAVRGLVHETLRLHGYTVLEARHGIEALLTSARYAGSIHLLLTDVVMPQMSGPEVAEKILTVRPEIKVLYMSGYPDHPVFDQGSVSRQTGVLAKPFSPHALAQKVREVLDSVKAA
ncbi:MAG TPA: PAS domain S-box protein [Nitrospiraceae bacterium]|nr:PAS domain S-box protein [Nitrospiraceae bacterium]